MNVKNLWGLSDAPATWTSTLLLVVAVASVIAAAGVTAGRDAGIPTFLAVVVAINLVAGLGVALAARMRGPRTP